MNSLVVHLVMCESSFIISFHPKPIPANIVNVATMVIGILLEFFHFLQLFDYFLTLELYGFDIDSSKCV